MTTLKVLHVVGNYPAPETPSRHIFVKTQIDSLIKAGIDCRVIRLKGKGLRKYLAGRRQIKQELSSNNYGLIHAHYAYCGFASLFHGVPVITSFMGSDLFGFPRANGSYSLWSRVFHINLARFVAHCSTSGIVKSEKMRSILKINLNIVPNGVDCSRFHPLTAKERTCIRTELGMSERTRYILFAGNPESPHKRFKLANQAVEWARTKLVSHIELLSVFGQSQETVIRYMQACDMLILTSSVEGSPNVIKEAMASNLPIVSVDVGDVQERLYNISGCRVVNNDQPDSIGAAIVGVFTRKEACGGRQAVSDLKIELVADNIISIYKKVLSAN